MNNLDVVKHGSLIDATSEKPFSQFEQQFIAEALSKISMEDNELKDTEIDVDELYEECFGGVPSGVTKKKAYGALEGLTEKKITIHVNGLKRKERASFSWLSLFVYDKVTGKATAHINKDAAIYLLNLDDNFTKIKREIYMLMSNTYGTRLLELMSKVYGAVNERLFTIEELRKLLHVGDRYPSNYDLKRYVIEPAIEGVNELADFVLSYEQIKTKRRISHFKFTKHKKKDLDEHKPIEF